MIETLGASEAIEEICAIEGLDSITLGPGDLSLAMTGNVDMFHAEVRGRPCCRSCIDPTPAPAGPAVVAMMMATTIRCCCCCCCCCVLLMHADSPRLHLRLDP
jgi:2-keto-3-deoxy-L-rhamnonate aldolase RhmA